MQSRGGRGRRRRRGRSRAGAGCESCTGTPPRNMAENSYIRRVGRRWYRGRMTADLPSDYFSRHVSEVDPEIARVLEDELRRQETTLEMIASENFVPQAILDCQGSVLTNKYAEGYPGRRYYGGCEYVDVAEQLAIDRA